MMIALRRASFPQRCIPCTAILLGYSRKITRSLLFFFLFLTAVNVANAQATDKFRVEGKVTQASGEPLEGATVAEKGTKTSTLTKADGSFSISVSRQNAALVISFVGYAPQEVRANNSYITSIALQPVANSMDEVVVIGYGTQKRKDLTGSVSSVSGKDIAAVPVANAAQALQGKLPGVNVIAQDGRPDASISIRVRGGGSISQSNEPLFIVDGFPVSSINDIPPSQIESIDVLKDAASTAIYGSRGGNGVIIITTKSGKAGKFTIGYDNYFQYNQPTKYLETMGAYDYIAYNWAYAKAINDNYAKAWESLWAKIFGFKMF